MRKVLMLLAVVVLAGCASAGAATGPVAKTWKPLSLSAISDPTHQWNMTRGVSYVRLNQSGDEVSLRVRKGTRCLGSQGGTWGIRFDGQIARVTATVRSKTSGWFLWELTPAVYKDGTWVIKQNAMHCFLDDGSSRLDWRPPAGANALVLAGTCQGDVRLKADDFVSLSGLTIESHR